MCGFPGPGDIWLKSLGLALMDQSVFRWCYNQPINCRTSRILWTIPYLIYCHVSWWQCLSPLLIVKVFIPTSRKLLARKDGDQNNYHSYANHEINNSWDNKSCGGEEGRSFPRKSLLLLFSHFKGLLLLDRYCYAVHRKPWWINGKRKVRTSWFVWKWFVQDENAWWKHNGNFCCSDFSWYVDKGHKVRS